MGEVYKARDTRLNRVVAVKVARKEFTERFEREARAVAALIHPHICQLYDVGPDYLVMEYVEGLPLKCPLPLDKALEYAGQIASALDPAHTNKITHRDLKPANILVTKSGGVKLLDFGLAKFDGPAGFGDATLDVPETAKGTILGTLLYMSAVQINGVEAGPRSDIFSFGLVLYEMLTGKRAFAGSTPASIIGAILERHAPSVAGVAPPALDRVLNRCLEKDPENRWQTARDLRAALELVILQSSPAAGVSPPSLQRWLWPALATAGTLVALTLAFLYPRQSSKPERRTVRFQILPPEKSSIEYFKLSPDGRVLAFTAERRLWIRSLDSLQAQPLAGTEGADKFFWSPDSQFIAFFAQGKLKTIAASGGPVQILCDVPEANGGTWNRDGIIVLPLSLTSGLFRISARGGDPVPLTHTGSNVIQQTSPEFLPDGRHFLYLGLGKPEKRGIRIGSLDGTPDVPLLPDLLTQASFVPAAGASGQDGYLLFRRGDTLMAQRFNLTRLTLDGEASPVVEKIEGSVLWAAFSVSENGTLVFRQSAGTTARQLGWWDRGGKQAGLFGPPGTYDDFRLAPDEKRLLYSDRRAPGVDLWVMDSVRGIPSRLTFNPGIDDPGIWSPDGLRVVWASNRAGLFDLYIKSANGAGREQLLVKMGAASGWPEDWSHDGRFIIYQIPGTKSGQDLWIAPQPSEVDKGDRTPFPYLQTEFDEKQGRFSPDGGWVAYTSNETGRDEVYVQPFPASGAKFRISAGGGREPHWRKNGTELFYISEDRMLMAVPVKLPGSALEPLQAGQPARLFTVQVVDDFIVGRSYEVSNDGQRFLMPVSPSGGAAAVTVLLNWQMQLKK
jgi:eukaryotic-like serine/threonine-protein kinase